FEFNTFDEDGSSQTHTFTVNKEDTLNDVLRQINSDDNNVRAFYDEGLNKVIMETTRTGIYNTEEASGKSEIEFADDNTFFNNVLELKVEKEAVNAEFQYNGLQMTSKTNSYDLNGINFQFTNVTDGNAKITVVND